MLIFYLSHENPLKNLIIKSSGRKNQTLVGLIRKHEKCGFCGDWTSESSVSIVLLNMSMCLLLYKGPFVSRFWDYSGSLLVRI